MPTEPLVFPIPATAYWESLTETEATTENTPQPMPDDWYLATQKIFDSPKAKNNPTIHNKAARSCECPNCGQVTVTKHLHGYCSNCEKCTVCKVAPWDPRFDSRVCKNCICPRCRVNPRNAINKFCERCENIKICTFCNRNAEANYHVRTIDRKRTLACQSCIRTSSKIKFRCFFCDGRARTVAYLNNTKKPYNDPDPCVICDDCYTRPSCYNAECSPTKQCTNCKAVQIQRDQQALHPEGQTGPLFKINKPIFHDAIPISLRKYNHSPRLAGGEIEFAGLKDQTLKSIKKLHALVDKWGGSILYDGSLPKGGGELAWAPAGGDLLLKQIDEIATTLHELGAWTNSQCGFHVHVDGRDHAPADIRKLIKFYAAIEPAVIRTQPYSRIMVMDPVNHKFYCKPCGPDYIKTLDDMSLESSSRIYTAVTKQKLITNIFGPDQWRPTKNDHYAAAKYKAFNVYSWFYHDRKTFEFRVHSGTTLPKKIKNWAMTCVAIIDTAYKLTERAIPKPQSIDESISLLLSIAPTESARTYLESRINRFRAEYDVNPPTVTLPKLNQLQAQLEVAEDHGYTDQIDLIMNQIDNGQYIPDEIDQDDQEEDIF